MDQYATVESTGSSGFSGLGFIKAQTGRTYGIQYSINAEGLSGPVKLVYFDGGISNELFVSNVNGGIL